jgi:hypothetical protein
MTSFAETPSPVPTTSDALRAVVGSHRDGEMNRSERIAFWLYAAMGTFTATVLLAAGTTAIVT